MNEDGVLILKGEEVASLLAGRELDVVTAVETAYRAHGTGHSSLPHSTFLHFPGDDVNRIIALPAFLGDGINLAGIKWVASFPGNLARNLERASALVVLNSLETGRPFVMLEGSLINAQRTAASAALAAKVLLRGAAPAALGVIGTGIVNSEVVRYVVKLLPGIRRFVLFDLDGQRSTRFRDRLEQSALPGASIDIAPGPDAVLAQCPLVSFATTAVRPHIADLSRCPPGAVHLHISLRDLTPESILVCDNVVDDPDHVCRAQTSVHLAEQLAGNRDFIRCSLWQLLEDTAPAKRHDEAVTVFSPFGLGVLDLAVSKMIYNHAVAEGLGTQIPSFFRLTEAPLAAS
jgi:2,3-diaminopropionate biosynthesis protein SbnB